MGRRGFGKHTNWKRVNQKASRRHDHGENVHSFVGHLHQRITVVFDAITMRDLQDYRASRSAQNMSR